MFKTMESVVGVVIHACIIPDLDILDWSVFLIPGHHELVKFLCEKHKTDNK